MSGKPDDGKITSAGSEINNVAPNVVEGMIGTDVPTTEDNKLGADGLETDAFPIISEDDAGSKVEIPDGWTPVSEPPNTDREVQLMWDDGSFGKSSIGFYDQKSSIPQNPEYFWWSYSAAARLHPVPMPDGHVIAWRELSDMKDDTKLTETDDTTKQAKMEALIDDLANDFKPIVADIEKGIKTTQNNYGRYMSVLSQLGKGNRDHTNLFALALIKAGANRQGVGSAIKILFP